MTDLQPGFVRWMADLEARHLRDLTPQEVARALRALSSTYVERRARLSGRGAFDTAGKRAAYALYYAPRRYQAVSALLGELPASTAPLAIVDAGCGTGAAGAAWAAQSPAGTTLQAFDQHPWAVTETRATLAAFGVNGSVRRGTIDDLMARPPRGSHARSGMTEAIVLSYVVNELNDEQRAALLPALVAAGARGVRVLVVEPLSRRTSPWWSRWADAVLAAGGRSDEWRLQVSLPARTAELGRAAGLDAAATTARTLYL